MSTEARSAPRPSARRPRGRRCIDAGRRLFAERGYAEVGTEEIVREAGVTRGALYHHFDGKRELLRAVYEQIESEIAEDIAGRAVPGASVLDTLRARRGALPRPLPRARGPADRAARRAGGARLGAVARDRRPLRARPDRGLLEAGIEAGEIRRQPVEPLAHALLGALDEVAMLVARADDPVAARAEAGETLGGLVERSRPRR